MKKALLISVLLVSLLQGCAFDSYFCQRDATVPEKTVKLDPKVLEPCTGLIPLPATFSTDPFGDILANVQANADAYAVCSKKQDDSIVLLKKFANTKESK